MGPVIAPAVRGMVAFVSSRASVVRGLISKGGASKYASNGLKVLNTATTGYLVYDLASSFSGDASSQDEKVARAFETYSLALQPEVKMMLAHGAKDRSAVSAALIHLSLELSQDNAPEAQIRSSALAALSQYLIDVPVGTRVEHSNIIWLASGIIAEDIKGVEQQEINDMLWQIVGEDKSERNFLFRELDFFIYWCELMATSTPDIAAQAETSATKKQSGQVSGGNPKSSSSNQTTEKSGGASQSVPWS